VAPALAPPVAPVEAPAVAPAATAATALVARAIVGRKRKAIAVEAIVFIPVLLAFARRP
jgi:hypothetical protein